MANNFNIVARLQVAGPNNVRQVARQIQSQLSGIRADVNVRIATGTVQRITNLNNVLGRVAITLRNVATNAGHANRLLQQLANTIVSFRSVNRNINIAPRLNQTAAAAGNAASQMHVFGEQAALAVRRFAAFAVPTTIFLGLVSAIKEGLSASIEFEKEMVRLSQVTGKGVAALSGLANEITRLSTGLGVSSKDLGNVATTLAQAGLSAKKTTIALEALARSSLAATFTSIEDTTEGAIAVFRQFNVEAEDLQGVIGSLNAVSAQFAVESDDLVSVIRRTGGAFKASGGNLNELLGLFTAVRSTTRESADSIATGFRTIFTRIQRPKTIQFLKELGIELQDAKGQFIGPLESIRRLNSALSEIPTTDLRFASVIEELGGFRQVSKVIPLIQQFPEALKAISVAEQGQQSIVEDSVTAQKSLANQIAKVREEFLALFRELTSDKSFQFFVRSVLDLAKGLIDVTRALKPLIPLIGGLAILQGARSLGGLAQGFTSGLRGKTQKRFAEGGIVPGSGSGDTVPAMLTPGEFVVKKSAAKAIGFSKLASMNKFAKGGLVKNKRLKKYDEANGIDEALSIAALLPVGKSPKTEFVESKFKSGGKDQTKKVKITTTALGKKQGSMIEGVILKKVKQAASEGADILQSSLGMERSQSKNIDGILYKSGIDATVGNIFEGALALAGAPYSDKKTNNAPIDFPRGVGPALAAAFPGLDPTSPTDAKRTASSKDFVNRNLKSYLIEKYNIGDDTPIAPRAIAGGGKGKFIKNQKDASPSKILTMFNRMSETQKDNFAAIVAKGSISEPLKRGEFESTGLNYATQGKILGAIPNLLDRLKKKASGGPIDGSGNSDSVPALLTPGEFVINKRSAQRIGMNQLNALNGKGVKKFARGGRVGQSFVSGGEGGGFAIAGLLSLSSSFAKLDDTTKKVVDSFAAVAASSAAVSFGIRGLANETKLRVLSTSRGINGPTGNRTANNVLGSTARNFESIANASALVSAGLVIFGQHLQDTALTSAKLATSQAELDKALVADQRGGIASGAGVGAGLGAAIGTAIAPGLGTAIGAIGGLVVGAIAGGFVNNNKELQKAFKQSGFDKTAEKIDNLFDDFSSNRTNIGTSASNISQEARNQLQAVKSTVDIEQRGELTKQLKNNLVNYRTLSTAIVQTVDDIDQFKSAYGSAGQSLIESISFLTKKSFPDVQKEIEKEIESRRKSIVVQDRLNEANSTLKSFTISINTLTESFNSISESISDAQVHIDSMTATIEGSFSGSKFNGISGDLFNRVASGGVQNLGEVSAATRNLTASLDRDSQQSIENQVNSVATLTNALPGILTNIANNVGLGADFDTAEQQLAQALDGLNNIEPSLKSVVKSIFSSELSSRESPGDSGFKKVAREDVLGLADKLIPDALKKFVQELDNVNKSAQNIVNTIGERIAKVNQQQLDISKKRADLEDRIFEVDKLRLAAGKEAQLSDVTNVVNKRRNLLLDGTGANSNLSAAGAASRILGAQARKNALQNTISTVGLGTVKQQEAQAEFGQVSNEITRLVEYLKDLSSSTAELTHLQEELSKAEADRKAGKDLIQGLLFGEGKDRVKFSDAFKNLQAVQGGNKNLIDLGPNQRKELLDLISQLPENRESRALGGKKPQDFLDEQLRKSFVLRAQREGANVPAATEFAKELTTRTKTETQIREQMIAVMEKANEADLQLITVNRNLVTALEAFNTKALQDMPQLIKNALSEAAIAGLTQTQKSVTSQRDLVGGKLDLAKDLTRGLGLTDIKQLKGAGTILKQNQANFDNLKKSEDEAKKFSLQNNLAKNKELAAASTFEKGLGRDGLIGNKKLGDQTAADLASKAIDSDAVLSLLGDKQELKDKLQKKLAEAAFNFGGVNSKTGRVGNTNTFQFNKQDESEQKNAVAAAINAFVTEIKDEKRGAAFGKAEESKTALDRNLRGTFGNDTDRFIEFYKNLDNLKAFTDLFDTANIPIEQSVREFTDLNGQLENLNVLIKKFRDQQAPIKPARAVERARGGLIGGRPIGSPLTTFTPKGTDRIPAILSRGEFVVNARAAAANAGLLESINAPGFARGGKASYRQRVAATRTPAAAAKRRLARADSSEMANFLARSRNRAANYSNEELTNMDDIAAFGVASSRVAREAYKYLPSTNKVGTQGADARALFEAEKRDRNRRIFDNNNRETKNAGVNAAGSVLEGIFGTTNRFNRLRFATGGPVPGAGNRDNVPALLTPGEFVLNRRATKSLGLNALSNFNQRFANGGVVTGGGGASGGMLNINPQALATLEKFYGTFTDAISQFGSNISVFSQASSTLSNALSSWGGAANRLSEALASMPREIQVTHSPIPVLVNVAGLENFKSEVTNEVMAAMDARMGSQRTKATDGKSPFFSR